MHEFRHFPVPNFVAIAVAFELALAVVGWGLAELAGVPLGTLVWPQPRGGDALQWGVLATLPMMPLLAAMLVCRWRPVAWLRRLVTRFVRQLFGKAPLWQIALVSVAAGFGEEVLFRGAIQPIVVASSSPAIGVVVVSLLFGLVHAASWSYFWLATLVGAYLGVLAEWRAEILSAIVAHALYDFIALTCIAHGCFVRHRPMFSIRAASSPTR